MTNLNFLTKGQISQIEKKYELPVYVYSEDKLLKAVENFKKFPSAFWHTVRYAMKANSCLNILRLFNKNWIKIDSSSEYEAERAINAWFKPEDIQLSWQESPKKLKKLVNKWVFFVATSLNQLKEVWRLCPGSEIWVRINPWVWSAAFKRINTWWWISSFWIWHEYISEIKKIANIYNLKIVKVHIHIWSENTPKSWVASANIWLDFVENFDDVKILNMWWWFKKAIMPYEESADLEAIWNAVKEKFEDFYKSTWRKIKLEVEPWKYMVIDSCSVIAKIVDIVDTWEEWYKFLRTNTGMTEMPRVTMYWVQQPIIVVNESKEKENYIVVWHCCESWDVLTTKLYDQETIEEFELSKASIWDTIVFDNTWAYSSAMSMKNYNSFPEAWELMIRKNWDIVEIRKRQEDQDLWKNEIVVI